MTAGVQFERTETYASVPSMRKMLVKEVRRGELVCLAPRDMVSTLITAVYESEQDSP
jgi:hypothetical protein